MSLGKARPSKAHVSVLLSTMSCLLLVCIGNSEQVFWRPL
jgi:hypothetical protein